MIDTTVSFSPEVAEALKLGKAIVALESTIISHGMPFPENRDTALMLENIIRKQGACPATIAIINGVIKIGLTQEEIEYLSKEDSSKVLKVSSKDIPFCLVRKMSGACTVAATMQLAHLGGIKVFATGGIGGVHRGAEHTFDISADLDELAKTPVAVICAGAKSILDLALTLEYLETKAVPVIGYKTDTLPAFYTSRSKHSLDLTLDSPEEIAEFLHAKWTLQAAVQHTRTGLLQTGQAIQANQSTGATTGVVIANPIPEEYSLDEDYISNVVEEALIACDKAQVRGKATTPFLLRYIADKTEKKSLFSNIELVKNNAELAAQIALGYAKRTN